jgi:hypothetical protein
MFKHFLKNEFRLILSKQTPNILKIISKLNIKPFSQTSKQYMDRHAKDQYVKKAKLVNSSNIVRLQI